MDIVAIIALRNGAAYIGRKIQHLHENEVEIVIIDNQSNDDSVQICLESGIPKENIYELPFDGTFHLISQLSKKEEIIKNLDCDWIIHTDVDEIINTPNQNKSLKEAIAEADQGGYDVINCDEFVFVPHDEQVDYRNQDYVNKMKYYYFFEPRPHRLMRIYKNDTGLSNISSAGHSFPIDTINLFPQPFVLRHYIGLSISFIKDKYVNRKFSQQELDMNWHRSRIHSWDTVGAPKIENLKLLENDKFDKSQPMKSHFWFW